MTEATVQFNVHELGIILSALQNLENVDENRIAREYGSITNSTPTGSRWTLRKLDYGTMWCPRSDL